MSPFKKLAAPPALMTEGDLTAAALRAATLKIAIAGSGDVGFYGDPELKRSIMGSGSVRRLGATPS